MAVSGTGATDSSAIKTANDAAADALNIKIGVTWKSSFDSVNLSLASDGSTKVMKDGSPVIASNNDSLIKAGYGYFALDISR